VTGADLPVAPPRLSRLLARKALERVHTELVGEPPSFEDVGEIEKAVLAARAAVAGRDLVRDDKTPEQLAREAELWRLLRDEAEALRREAAPPPQIVVSPPSAAASRPVAWRLVYGLVASVVGALVLGWLVGVEGSPVLAACAGAVVGHGVVLSLWTLRRR
jgi:hypothetical protein